LERFLSPRKKKWRQTWPWISSKGIPSRVCITKYVPQLAQWFVWLLAWTAEVLACTRGQQIDKFEIFLKKNTLQIYLSISKPRKDLMTRPKNMKPE
jgi:hypothetical protein